MIYGMRLIAGEEIAAIEHAQVLMEDGKTRQVTMHIIEGTKEQVKEQLLQSLDAFFDIHS